MEYCILFYGVACVCILSVKIYGDEYFRSVDFYFFCTLYYKLYASHTHEIHLYLPTKQSTLKQRSNQDISTKADSEDPTCKYCGKSKDNEYDIRKCDECKVFYCDRDDCLAHHEEIEILDYSNSEYGCAQQSNDYIDV